jgi:hypothetical protein
MNATTGSTSPTDNGLAVSAESDPSRCQHRFANNKRCRLPASDPRHGLCIRHFTLRAAAKPSLRTAHDDSEDLSPYLLGLPTERSSPMQVKQFLARLLVLVTEGRISPRRAAVLVNITNQLRYSHSAPSR